MNYRPEPLPALGRMMAFIDGENLVARFQAMLEAGEVPTSEVTHRRDVYAWGLGTIQPALNIVRRATYYTYVVGSEEAANGAAMEIRALRFTQYEPTEMMGSERLGVNLYPRVFLKPKKRRGKGVDIQMAVDMLSNTYHDNLDTVYLVSGDGDFEPLIAECQRYGKQVFVAALSSGLSPKLRLIADRFINLDPYYFSQRIERSVSDRADR